MRTKLRIGLTRGQGKSDPSSLPLYETIFFSAVVWCFLVGYNSKGEESHMAFLPSNYHHPEECCGMCGWDVRFIQADDLRLLT
ncbi:hypothetical protein Y032_0601g507 [Ancylostoma ceylanicum]|uniref:Uncharacterized protein n=1 Tax=Ancylostoma ceylanicum TaxID=53326 RepID=A0A016WLJ7_9BILA|nr:hypothetical protein Y032_0601g507 [Ancylostoma ceylanicum]